MAAGNDQESAEPQRRRVVEETEDHDGRRGCLWAGGILGIVVGAVFAFVALGPLLNHFFGEATVEPGATYDGIDIDIELLRGDFAGEFVTFTLRVDLDEDREEAFPLDGARWELELDDGSRHEANAVMPRGGEDDDAVAPGEAREIDVIFGLGALPVGDPEVLRLSEPRVRFEAGHLFDDE